MVKTDIIENMEFDKDVTDLVKRDQVVQRIDAYLRQAPLNIERDDYCYVRIVGNHLEIGRAKIVIEE
jgi:hypothetical protein